MNNTQECIHSIGNASVATLFSGKIMPFIVEHPWLFILPLTIVLSDLWFGVNESKKNKIEVRFSGAGWKTIRKLLDYYTLLSLGFVVGHTFPEYIDITVSEACFYSVLIPSFFDLCSITGHILILRGIKISPMRFLVNLFVGFVKTKNQVIGNVLEDDLNKELDNNKNK